MTQDDLAGEAGVNRDTVSALENGLGVRPSTVDKVRRALDRLEAEAGIGAAADAAPRSHLMEFEVSGDFGVRVVVRGPVEDAEALERSVQRLVRNIREGEGGSP